MSLLRLARTPSRGRSRSIETRRFWILSDIMVVGHHLIFSTYGFWLPNDPRGSWTEFVASWELLSHGAATKSDGRRSVAHVDHDHSARMGAKKSLQRPPVKFTGQQALSVSRGFAEYARKSRLIIWACAILPEHVHLVVARHRLRAESLVNQLKGSASRQLHAEGIHPCSTLAAGERTPPTTWAVGHWKVFLNTTRDVARSVAYVGHNPEREGKPIQKWSFVTPFEGFPDS